MLMLGFPQQRRADACTIKHSSPKLDSDFWWGTDQGQGSLWFLGVLGLKDSPTLPVSWSRRSHSVPVSLHSAWARALSSVTGTMDSAQSSWPLHWA